MTPVTDIQFASVMAIGNGWIAAKQGKSFFITPDGAVQVFEGFLYIDMPNNRFAVTKEQNFEGKENGAIFVSGPEIVKAEWSWLSYHRSSYHRSKWSVSDNDVFSAGLNDIRRNRDLKGPPNTLYEALIPRQFVNNVFSLSPCNRTIVVYSITSGKFQAIKTPIKDPQVVVAKDGMTIMVFGFKSTILPKYKNTDRHFCIIDNPLV